MPSGPWRERRGASLTPCINCKKPTAKLLCEECVVVAGSAIGEGIAGAAIGAVKKLWGMRGTLNRASNARPAKHRDAELVAALRFFGLDDLPTKGGLDAAYRSVAKQVHPDHGGSDRLMSLANHYRAVVKRAM
jgi:hypothetical protein